MGHKALFALGILLAGCGGPGNAPAKKPDVSVALDGVHHVCVVALANEEQGSSIACSDVVPFLRDELRVPAGATYILRMTSPLSDAESAGVNANLKSAGYRPTGDP
jgi:hypothetical protein